MVEVVLLRMELVVISLMVSVGLVGLELRSVNVGWQWMYCRCGLLDPVLGWLMCWVMAAESHIDGRFVLVGVKIFR